MNYTKGIKEVKMVLHDGDEVSVSDSATSRSATEALTMFEADKRVKVVDSEKTTLVPYHSILAVEIKASTVSVDRDNPYYCEAESGSKGMIVDKSKACECALSE